DGDRYRTTFALRPGTGASRVTRLRLRSTDIRNTIVDLGDRGRSPGDLSVYNGRLRGDARGWVRGVHTSVRIEGRTETLASAITFELRGRGQIAVGGLTRYPAGDRHKPVRGATVRAVLGGTGDFAGAHGTLRSVRRANGAYELRFSLGAP
ncbi:MAG: hypothetical protein IRZ32_15605, partial [Solirubrobacteraceae bacterium]|nr:hypothetical protein [Solirubrobacteraceae bacterium]